MQYKRGRPQFETVILLFDSSSHDELELKHWDSACLRQGTSYQCRDPNPDPYPDPRSGWPPKFNRLFICPLPTFPENFMQIRSEVFAQSCKQADKQTDKQRRLHILLGGGNKDFGFASYLHGVHTLVPAKVIALPLGGSK